MIDATQGCHDAADEVRPAAWTGHTPVNSPAICPINARFQAPARGKPLVSLRQSHSTSRRPDRRSLGRYQPWSPWPSPPLTSSGVSPRRVFPPRAGHPAAVHCPWACPCLVRRLAERGTGRERADPDSPDEIAWAWARLASLESLAPAFVPWVPPDREVYLSLPAPHVALRHLRCSGRFTVTPPADGWYQGRARE
jgi:hypothetical protein